MDFRQLETFLTVTKYMSFSKASRELFLTQPALSNQIKNLEKELQTPLFDRKGKSIDLTPAGKLFRESAIELIKKKEIALFEISDLMDKFKGVIEIPCSTVPSETIVPRLISLFIKEFPGSRLKLFSMDTSDVIDAIEDKKYALGFVGSRVGNDFDSVKVYSDDMAFIGPSSHPLVSDTIYFEYIVNLPLIVREEGSGSGGLINKALKEHGLSREDLNIVSVTENVHIIKELVASNVGFAFVPRSSLGRICDDRIKVYQVSNFDSHRDFYFIKQKASLLTPLEARFSNFVFENASKFTSE